jgi:hypothetical protein
MERYLPTDEPVDTKTFCSRAYGLSCNRVTWQHRDPVTYWLRREYPKADSGDRRVWFLDPDMQVRAHRYLLVVADEAAPIG